MLYKIKVYEDSDSEIFDLTPDQVKLLKDLDIFHSINRYVPTPVRKERTIIDLIFDTLVMRENRSCEFYESGCFIDGPKNYSCWSSYNTEIHNKLRQTYDNNVSAVFDDYKCKIKGFKRRIGSDDFQYFDIDGNPIN